MLRVLLESRAGRQRRSAGATFSVVAHVAVIAAAVVGTAQGRPAPPERPVPIAVVLPTAVHKHEVVPERRNPSPSRVAAASNVVVRTIEAPRFVPPALPAIDASALATDSIVVGAGPSRTVGSLVGDMLADAPEGSGSWDVHEVLMHVLATVSPRYPESLRSAGIDGRVLLQFTVDTAGRVDPSSVTTVSSTHELFTRAAREALSGFRFRPAQVGGRHVPALAQMPFEFRITR